MPVVQPEDSKDDLQAYLEYQSINHNNKIQQQAQVQQQFNQSEQHINSDSPIPSSNVEVSFTPNPPKRRMMDIDEASNYGGAGHNTLNRNIKYQNNLEHSINLDEHGAFGMYVGEVLRKLPQNVSALTSLKIMQILYEAQTSQPNTSTTMMNGIHNNND